MKTETPKSEFDFFFNTSNVIMEWDSDVKNKRLILCKGESNYFILFGKFESMMEDMKPLNINVKSETEAVSAFMQITRDQ